MTNEEREIITRFIERISGAAGPSGFGGSVPGTQPALPPVDREADTLIGDLFTRYPDARYRLTQTAFVQEHALVEAQTRLQRLEAEVQQLRQAQQTQPQQQSRGFLGGLFGGHSQPQQPQYRQPSYQPPPQYQQPQYPPGYGPGALPRSGSGFLGSALTTAAGVAGGMVVGNALMDLFTPHHEMGGGFGAMEPGAGAFGAGADPWGGAAGAPPDQGNDWSNVGNDPSLDPQADQGWNDASNDSGQDAGWDDQSGGGGDGGGWDDI